MNEEHVDEPDSVDLTEDEDSTEGNSENGSHFHFVNCSGSLNYSVSTSEAKTSVQHSSAAVSHHFKHRKEATTLKHSPVTPNSNKLNTVTNKKVGQFTSVQIKPPTSSMKRAISSVRDTRHIPEGGALHKIETVSLDSDDELEPTNQVHNSLPLQQNLHTPTQRTGQIKLSESNSIYSQQQPPGKIVIIKKNNKYYKIIIPHNVMPNITQSVGSVLINIPEVGPLVISNDPQATKVKAASQLKPQQLSLNLDAVQQNQDSTNAAEQVKDSHLKKLRDKKFCWSYNTMRKRDLEGFTMTDRQGFHKADALKSKKCAKRIDCAISNLERNLTNKMAELKQFKMSLLKRNTVKLVKINSILEKGRATNEYVSHLESNETDNYGSDLLVPKKVVTERVANKFVSNLESDETDDYGSDLLVTKKVVILNEQNNEIKKKRTCKEFCINKIGGVKRKMVKDIFNKVKKGKLSKYYSDETIRPCLVHIVKDRQVEEAYVKYCKDMGLAVKTKPVVNSKSQGKLFDHQHDGNVNVRTSSMISAKKCSNETKPFEKSKGVLISKVIRSQQTLLDEIISHKPFLILTDQIVRFNRTLEYYYDLFSENNIIYIVNSKKSFKNSILKAEDFVSAVEVGYVKLVDADLFGRFVANGMKFSTSRSGACRDEHNYALLERYNLGL